MNTQLVVVLLYSRSEPSDCSARKVELFCLAAQCVIRPALASALIRPVLSILPSISLRERF